jgi:hypothetical protein
VVVGVTIDVDLSLASVSAGTGIGSRMWTVDSLPRAGKANFMKIGAISATLGAVALLAGCGSSSSPSTSSATTPAPTSSASSTSSTASSTAGSSFASSGNCLRLAGVGSTFAQALRAALGGGGKVDLQAAVKLYQDLANAAPSAIQPDVQTISQAFSTFVAALAKTGYTVGQVPTASQSAALQSAGQVFSGSKVRTAELNVAAWAKQNCTHP